MAEASKTSKKKILTFVVALGALSMGNESCQKAKGRILKMDVEVGSMQAKPVRLPTGEVIDFPQVTNALFYRQVMNSDHFVIAGQNAGNSASTQRFSAVKRPSGPAMNELTKNDQAVLSNFGFLNKSSTGKLSFNAVSDDDAQMPACLYQLPLARLGGEVISFQTTFGGGVNVGYGRDGSIIPVQVGGNVDFESAKLELGLRWDDPLRRQVVAIADGVSHQAKVKFGVAFSPGVPLGLNFFFNTPLSDVIRTAMDRGLALMVGSYTEKMGQKTWHEAWESRVVFDPVIADNDTHIAFKGGSFAGLKPGDTFVATNLHYQWEGAACDTPLRYKIPVSDPVAELEVIRNGDTVTVARVTKYLSETRIRPGAQIKLLKLWEPPPEPKK